MSVMSSCNLALPNETIIWKADEDNNLRAYRSSDLKTPVVWAAQPGSQQSFLSCPVREVLYSGTRGPGKTDALLMDYLQHVGTGLGASWVGILFRRTYPELEDVIRKSQVWFPQIYPNAKYNKSSHTWTFPDGEILKFAFIDSMEDYDKYHGHQYPWIGWEELTNWATDKMFRKMMSTNRSSDKRVPIKIRATCNPTGPGHNWVKRRYRLPVIKGHHTELIQEVGRPARIAIHGTIHENKILLHAQPDYIETLTESCDNEGQIQAWIFGSWEVTDGGMFDDIWEKKYHVITGLTFDMIPAGWKIDRSYDHGQSKPFSVGFWAESNGEPVYLPDGTRVGIIRGDLFRVAEWYGSTGEPDVGLRMTADEIAVGIRYKQKDLGIDGRCRPGPADSSIYDEFEPSKSIAGDMKKKWVTFKPADKGPGSRKQGWQQMRKMLKNAKPLEVIHHQGTIHETTSLYREKPGLFISDQCVDFLRTVPVISRDPKDLDDVNTKVEDHIADEVRYRCRAKLSRKVSVTTG